MPAGEKLTAETQKASMAVDPSARRARTVAPTRATLQLRERSPSRGPYELLLRRRFVVLQQVPAEAQNLDEHLHSRGPDPTPGPPRTHGVIAPAKQAPIERLQYTTVELHTDEVGAVFAELGEELGLEPHASGLNSGRRNGVVGTSKALDERGMSQMLAKKLMQHKAKSGVAIAP